MKSIHRSRETCEGDEFAQVAGRMRAVLAQGLAGQLLPFHFLTVLRRLRSGTIVIRAFRTTEICSAQNLHMAWSCGAACMLARGVTNGGSARFAQQRP
jgi:hypothetical protein